MYEVLKDVPGISMQLSESGILSWVNVSKLGDTSEVILYLMQHAKVSVNSGDPYGEGGKGHIRIVHSVFGTDEEVEKAAFRMRKAFIQLASEKGIC